MTTRKAHLVGSLPLPDVPHAMRWAMDTLGSSLRSLPDGEPGERSNWIIHIIEKLREHPDVEITRQGDWSDIDHAPRFRIRPGHTLRADTLSLGLADAFLDSYETFRQLRSERDRTDLRFLVGVPGPMDLSSFAFGPAGGFRHRGIFTEALLRHVRQIHEHAGDDVVVQIEIPLELVAISRTPGFLQRSLARVLTRSVTNFAAACPEGTRFGVHLCYGDYQNKALGRQGKRASGVVALANSVMSRWPAGQSLEYVHLPMAAGEHPSPVNREYYAPLRALTPSEGVQVVAGFVHEDHDMQTHREILGHIEDALGQPVDIAAACGLGRRSLEVAEHINETTARLCRE